MPSREEIFIFYNLSCSEERNTGFGADRTLGYGWNSMCTEKSDPLAVDHPDGGFLLDGGELLVGVNVVERRRRGERCHCREVTGAVWGLPRASLAQVVPHLLVQAFKARKASKAR